MDLGERALALSKEFTTPPIPRNYELLYAYAAGFSKELSEAIRALVAEHNTLTSTDAEQLYETYLSPDRFGNQIEEFGQQLSSEVGEILASLQSASDTASSYGASLELVNTQLGNVSGPEQFKAVLQSVISATKKMADDNHKLESGLQESQKHIKDLQKNLDIVRAESLTDALTGLANRKRFDWALNETMRQALASDTPMCLLLIDIDHFKKFNDTYGHQAGDGVLKLVARTMKSAVKGLDMVARYGGEEFGIILPNTGLKDGVVVAEQVRKAVMAKELIKRSTGESLGRVTLSIGVAEMRGKERPADIIQRADVCLYAAKDAGRNKVMCDPGPALKSEQSAA